MINGLTLCWDGWIILILIMFDYLAQLRMLVKMTLSISQWLAVIVSRESLALHQ